MVMTQHLEVSKKICSTWPVHLMPTVETLFISEIATLHVSASSYSVPADKL